MYAERLSFEREIADLGLRELPMEADTPTLAPGKGRTHWRADRPLFYKTKAMAEGKMKYVQSLGESELLKLNGTIAVEPPGLVQEREGYTFYYFPLTESQAKDAKIAAEAKLGKNDIFTVEFDNFAKSFYIRPKCPGSALDEAGWTKWGTCFPKEDQAKAQVKKLQEAHIEAKIGQLQKDKFYVLFQPLSQTEAKAKGDADAKTHGGFDEGMFKVETKNRPELGSWTYELKVVCPEGYRRLGNYRITSYFTAKESDFPETPTVKDPCVKGIFRERFLHNGNRKGDKSPFAWTQKAMGSRSPGRSSTVRVRTATKRFRMRWAWGNRQLTIGKSVAVDKTVIPIVGTQLLIQDVGLCIADDVGDMVKDNHIDLFKGLFDKAKDTTLRNKVVCLKKKP